MEKVSVSKLQRTSLLLVIKLKDLLRRFPRLNNLGPAFKAMPQRRSNMQFIGIFTLENEQGSLMI